MVSVGIGLLIIGAVGMMSVVMTQCRCLLTGVFLAYFFASVFTIWCFLYTAVNFSEMEDSIKRVMERNWNFYVADFPDGVKAMLPIECGGTSNTTVITVNATSDNAFDQCYDTVQSHVSDNFSHVATGSGVAAFLMLVTMFTYSRVVGLKDLTANEKLPKEEGGKGLGESDRYYLAPGRIKTAIDTGMALVGFLLVIVAAVIMTLSGATATSKLCVPLFLLGGLMIFLGVILGIFPMCHADKCHAGEKDSCCKCLSSLSLVLYSALLLAFIGCAIGCLFYQDKVETVVEENADFLDEICDAVQHRAARTALANPMPSRLGGSHTCIADGCCVCRSVSHLSSKNGRPHS